MNTDSTASDLKGRFDIPDRGLALKKVETCFNSKDLLKGFRFYDKQDKNIFEWRCEDSQQTVTTILRDGERIVDDMLSWGKEKTGIV
jgi:hypothetical protein